MEHAVNLCHRLVSILKEEDDVRHRQGVKGRTSQAMKHRHVSADKDATGMAGMVEGMGLNTIDGQVTNHHTTQCLTDGISTLVGTKGMTHGAVNANVPHPRLGIEQGGDIAETDDEFESDPYDDNNS